MRRTADTVLGFEDGVQTHSVAATSTVAAYRPQIGKGGRLNAIEASGIALSDEEAAAAHLIDQGFLVAIGAL